MVSFKRCSSWRRPLLCVVTLWVAWVPFSVSSVLTLKPDAPTTYVVVKGDTLWDISALYLDSPWLWPRLWQVNPDIDNPHLIYPGDKLNLIWRNGEPVLTVKPMHKLSPKVRKLDKQALPTLREEWVLPYLESDLLLDESLLAESAKVIGSSNGLQYLTGQQLLYVTGQQVQGEWHIYRKMTTFTRDDKRVIALKKIAVAESADESTAPSDTDMTALKVRQQTQEILEQDIALPVREAQSDFSQRFYPQPSPKAIDASILGSLEGSQYVGKHQVVVIDRGARDALRQGSMFDLYQPGHKVAKAGQGVLARQEVQQLPDVRIGHLMVIRPYQDFSLALVTQSEQPIATETRLRSPLATLKSAEDVVDAEQQGKEQG